MSFQFPCLLQGVNADPSEHNSKLLTGHNQPATFAILILDSFDGDIQRRNSVVDGLVLQSSKAQLFNGVVGVGNEFSEKDLSV